MYLIWNTQLQGWMSHGSYNSDRAFAKEFTREAAFDLARNHFKSYKAMHLLPISVADYNEVAS